MKLLKLYLYPSDLRPEFREGEGDDAHATISAHEVTFDKLNDEAQDVMHLVGRATYRDRDHRSYNVIYVPKEC